ncbi:hypothetical protein SEPCBS57363_005600 [Sporothrix epigloea]|uniref:Gamma interferon inducible lysosomal thiol reductase n=1 Tax=Sporothrix epigloea TaxID=1892477 RepID=A0ABP0DYF6_9PEZI
MDEKRLLAGLVEPDFGRRNGASVPFRRRLPLRLGFVAALILFGLTFYVFLQPEPFLEVSNWSPATFREEITESKAPISAAAPKKGAARPVHTNNRLVPFEAHIMSKCPDAVVRFWKLASISPHQIIVVLTGVQDCLRELVLPTMQHVVDNVNFTLSYIGRPTGDGGVECMHGPAECMGNILELCAHKLNPDPKIYLGFTMCISQDYQHIPDRELIEGCALEHAVDFEALNECATRDDGQYAMNLLRDSVQHTKAVGVTKSCTVRVDNEVYCIRDDGKWTDCPAGPGVRDLIIKIAKLSRQN